MSVKVIDKEQIPSFVTSIMGEREVVGPVAKDGKFVFDKIEDSSQLRLDYNITLMSPKKYFLPPEEVLLTYRLGEAMSSEPVIEAKPRVIMGVHPCDINASRLLDLAFSTDNVDNNYMSKRKQALVVGLDCNEPCDDHSFCKSTGSLMVDGGYDLFLTDIGDAYTVDCGSSEGEALLEVLSESSSVEVPCPRSGTLLERIVEEDEIVRVGEPVAILDCPEEEWEVDEEEDEE